jgi:hypothetical protein
MQWTMRVTCVLSAQLVLYVGYQREKMHGAKPHIWEQHSGKLG